MKAYRDIRSKVPFKELCRRAELASEVTVMACERIGADAAIIFSDILLLIECLGVGLEYETRGGPLIKSQNLIKSDFKQLKVQNPDEMLAFVYDAIHLTRRSLRAEIPLIGFAGAPFTMASYVIEGGSTKNFARTKAWIVQEPEKWAMLMEHLSELTVRHLQAQIKAGANVVQLFDSWAGCLDGETYRKYVLPYSQRVITQLRSLVPTIHFGTGTFPFLKEFASAGSQVVGVDFRASLNAAWDLIGHDKAIQGNMDPAILLGKWPVIREAADHILKQVGKRPGYIFNLGHGVLPQTPEQNVIDLIRYVHEQTSGA